MMGIQDWVHALEVGEGRKYIKLLAAFLGLLTLTTIYDVRKFRNFSTSEAMDVAQLARNISEGKGFVTDHVRPFSIYLQQRERVDRASAARGAHADIANAPVYPLLLAGWMKIAPMDFFLPGPPVVFTKSQPEMLIAFLNQTLFFAVILMTFFVTKSLFDGTAGVLAAIVVALTELLWRFSISGLSTMLLLLIFLGIVRLLIAAERLSEMPDSSAGPFLAVSFGLGLLLAIGMLTRYSFGVIAIPVVLYLAIFLPRYRLLVTSVALSVFLVAVSPWLVRNFQLSGNLLGISGYAFMEDTLRFPDQRLQRSLNPDFSRVLATDVTKKMVQNLSEIIRNDLPKLGESWIAAFFLVGLLVPFRGAGLSRLRWFTVVTLLVLGVTQSLCRTFLSEESPTVNSENLLILAFPLVVVFGIAMLETLMDHFPVPFPEARHIVTGVVLAAVSVPFFINLLPPRTVPVAYPPYHPPVIQQTARYLGTDDLMMSDVPWAVAWYGRRTAIWNTINIVPDFYTINDLSKPIKGIYLTQVTTDVKLGSEVLLGADFSWQRFALDAILRTNLPAGFPLKHGRRDYQDAGQLFLSDRNRWGFRNR